MHRPSFRKDLGLPGLLATARKASEAIPGGLSRTQIPLAGHLVPALALFGLKYPPLLQFDRESRHDEAPPHNLRTLYGIAKAPSDTFLRERLGQLGPKHLRLVYRQLFAPLQRGKGLEGFDVLDGHYLLPVDGTGVFPSQETHCPQCCEKHHRNGQATYYHQP
jgi:hypothetical protein